MIALAHNWKRFRVGTVVWSGFFFFQAEDGIRDDLVTGVQTCALPISAVFAEMLALPLIHTAWITATAGAIAHIGVLAQRLSTEERVLFANPDYRAAMT